jgi:small-conductance mechanosensitive channel/CRP-like cAMP-binding protein
MLKRSLLKIALILLFSLLPSLAFLVFIQVYGSDVLGEYWKELKDPALLHDSVPWKVGMTFLGISVTLILLTFVGFFLSPDFHRKRFQREMPALLRDLIRYVIFVLAIALILKWVWGEGVTPLLGALGIGGIVLGFALQETLSNFFAGLALLAEQPFRPGDWVRIGEHLEGTVEQITWRAVKIRTRDNDYQIFPNSAVAKETIINYLQPSRAHAIRIDVGTSYSDPPDLVKKTLLGILASIPEVLKTPPPSIYLKRYGDFSINYQIKCYIEDYERRPQIEDRILHRMWYAFRRDGIEIPFPIQTAFEYKIPWEARPQKGQVNVPAVLDSIPLFSPFSPEARAQLATNVRILDYAAGELVLRQGDPGDSLYAIVSGSARVTVVSEDRTEHTVAVLREGDVFGEMSLLTGEPRSASVHAEERLVLCAVSKGAVLPLLAANPSMAERMAEIITLRRQGLERARSEVTVGSPHLESQHASRNLLVRIRKFFHL